MLENHSFSPFEKLEAENLLGEFCFRPLKGNLTNKYRKANFHFSDLGREASEEWLPDEDWEVLNALKYHPNVMDFI